MKTTILQCLQQFPSKNGKNVYDDKFIKTLKLQCHCKIVQNVHFTLSITRFMKTAILQCLQHRFSLKTYVFVNNCFWE